MARSSSRSPSSTAVMVFSPEKGFSDLGPKSEMNSFFKLKSDTGAATAEGADVITKYATWVVP